MGCIPKELCREIREKMDYLNHNSNCTHFLIRQRKRIKAIRKNAQIESFRIEHPNLPVPYNVPRSKRENKKGIRNISDAFEWGKKNFSIKDINESFLRELSFKITPDIYPGQEIAEYRPMGVRPTCSEFTSPYPWKVKNIEIPNFITNLKNHLERPEIIEQMKTAIYAHFNLARIHPFEDGNGRVARTFQDIILDYFNFPFPIIPAGERMTYYNFLEEAIRGYKDRKSERINRISQGEANFYTFMAGKVNSSLDKVLNCRD